MIGSVGFVILPHRFGASDERAGERGITNIANP